MLRYVLLLILLPTSFTYAQEICDNGIDDDGDGLIDLNDSLECDCGGLTDTTLIPNPSFEEYSNCPDYHSQMDRLDSWYQASSPTSDFLHTCGYLPSGGAIETFGLVPFPHGNGIVGEIITQDYKEYIGVHLTSPMLAGETYTIEFYIAGYMIRTTLSACPDASNFDLDDINITLFGHNAPFPFPFAGNQCPGTSEQWMELGHVGYTPNASWEKLTLTFTPSTDIRSLVLGSPCTLPSSYPNVPTENNPSDCKPYFAFDDIRIVPSDQVEVHYSAQNCEVGILNATYGSEMGSWQWFYEGVALVGQTDSILDLGVNNLPPGEYTAIYSNGGKCEGDSFIIGSLDGDTTYQIEETCASFYWDLTGETYHESGLYEHLLQNMYGCDSLIILDLEANQTGADGTAMELVDLPNIITANNDGVNDFINMIDYVGNCAFTYTIINRWGQRVFEQTPASPPFYGKDLRDNELVEGTYFYTLNYAGGTKHGMITIER